MNNEKISPWEEVIIRSIETRKTIRGFEQDYARRCSQIGEELGFLIKEIVGGYLKDNPQCFKNGAIDFGQHGYSLTTTGEIMLGDRQVLENEGNLWFSNRNIIMTAIEHNLMRNSNS